MCTSNLFKMYFLEKSSDGLFMKYKNNKFIIYYEEYKISPKKKKQTKF